MLRFDDETCHLHLAQGGKSTLPIAPSYVFHNETPFLCRLEGGEASHRVRRVGRTRWDTNEQTAQCELLALPSGMGEERCRECHTGQTAVWAAGPVRRG
jgi:hypothetical protein